MAIVAASAFAIHPGEWLRTEIVEAHGLSVTRAARHLGVTRQAMSMVLNGRAGLSADVATRFEKAFGVKADTLLRMRRRMNWRRRGRGRMRSWWSGSARRLEAALAQ